MIFGWNPPIFEQTNALMKLNIERSKKKRCTYVDVLLPETAAHIQVH